MSAMGEMTGLGRKVMKYYIIQERYREIQRDAVFFVSGEKTPLVYSTSILSHCQKELIWIRSIPLINKKQDECVYMMSRRQKRLMGINGCTKEWNWVVIINSWIESSF